MKLVNTATLRADLGSYSKQEIAKKYGILLVELDNFIYSHITKNGVYPVDNVRNKGKRFTRTQLNAFKRLYDKGTNDVKPTNYPTAIRDLQDQFTFVCKLTGLAPNDLKNILK